MNLYNIDKLKIFKLQLKGGSELYELKFNEAIYGMLKTIVGGAIDPNTGMPFNNRGPQIGPDGLPIGTGFNTGVGRMGSGMMNRMGSMGSAIANSSMVTKGISGFMFLSMLGGALWIFLGQKNLETHEKINHLIGALMAGIFGPLGDVWARCAFYNGAIEIDNLKQKCWSFLVALPLISNIIGFWVHVSGQIQNIPKKVAFDNFAIILLFLPVIVNYSLKHGVGSKSGPCLERFAQQINTGGVPIPGKFNIINGEAVPKMDFSGPNGVVKKSLKEIMKACSQPDKKIFVMTIVLFMGLLLARIYRKTTVCTKIIREKDINKFTVSYAANEALNGMIFVNLLLLFMIVFCKMAGYPDIDGDIGSSVAGGVTAMSSNLWNKMGAQGAAFGSGYYASMLSKILKYIFGPALILVFTMERIAPGIFHGILLSTYHLIRNSKMNIDDSYLTEFCTETKDIDAINFTPKFTFAYNKPWKWIGIFKFLGALALGAMAKLIVPAMQSIPPDQWAYIGGGGLIMFLVMFVSMRMSTAMAKRKIEKEYS